MRTKLTYLFIGLVGILIRQEPQGWEIFEDVVFEPTYFKDIDSYFDVPTFNKELLALEKTEVTLSGFYIPLELDSVFMLSAMPFSSCFFCGGAGPESVAEIQFMELPKRLEPDEFVKIRGILKLNRTDIDHMNFILQDAKVIK